MSTQITLAAFPEKAAQLIEVCTSLGQRGWAPATGGNFSVRVDQAHCLITRSGRDKSQLVMDDLMLCDLQGKALDESLSPSAELALHNSIYHMDNNIGAVLHTHSVNSTVLSRATHGDLLIQGYEMQKALSGNLSHEQIIGIAVFENDQDINALAERVQQRWQQGQVTQPGLLVRGHGLYAWGKDLAEAKRHIEAFEFLFACVWQEKLKERV